ncbi:MAG: hypothetical protein A2Z17_04480 [Gammaproteobacteria bacterium RBG_16_66_13]|nr:MAG: hypothetical protein A2Z17_04480 [Gammaproteobacteria bacterium RBG_16_66_13]
MLLDAGPGSGSFPWWVFLMMPVMMGGMGLMMWLMMRMMMGSHGSHGASEPPKPAGDQGSVEEMASLRSEVEVLRRRLAALEVEPVPRESGDEPPRRPRPEPQDDDADGSEGR